MVLNRQFFTDEKKVRPMKINISLTLRSFEP